MPANQSSQSPSLLVVSKGGRRRPRDVSTFHPKGGKEGERGGGEWAENESLPPSPAAAHAFARPDRARQSAGKAAKAGRPTLAQWFVITFLALLKVALVI